MAAHRPVNLALIGAGRIGSFHAESVARRLVDANLVAIADPAPGAAKNWPQHSMCPKPIPACRSFSPIPRSMA